MRYAWLLVAGGLFAAEVKLDKAMTPPVWALLELYKQGEATWTQHESFGEIEIEARTDKPAWWSEVEVAS